MHRYILYTAGPIVRTTETKLFVLVWKGCIHRMNRIHGGAIHITSTEKFRYRHLELVQ